MTDLLAARRGELVHGDCIEVMRGMPDESISAVVTDPPYGLDVLYGLLHDVDQVGSILDAISEAGLRIVPVRPAFTDPHVTLQGLVEGQLNSRHLIEAAAEFDRIDPDGDYSASDFIAWLLPEVKGTLEEQWVAAASLWRSGV